MVIENSISRLEKALSGFEQSPMHGLSSCGDKPLAVHNRPIKSLIKYNMQKWSQVLMEHCIIAKGRIHSDRLAVVNLHL